METTKTDKTPWAAYWELNDLYMKLLSVYRELQNHHDETKAELAKANAEIVEMKQKLLKILN